MPSGITPQGYMKASWLTFPVNVKHIFSVGVFLISKLYKNIKHIVIPSRCF